MLSELKESVGEICAISEVLNESEMDGEKWSSEQNKCKCVDADSSLAIQSNEVRLLFKIR